MYDSGFRAIHFGPLRANQSGGEHWIKVTTDRFVESLDEHLDEALRQYDAMLKLLVETIPKLHRRELGRESFVAFMLGQHPFTREAPPDCGSIWDAETRTRELNKLSECVWMLQQHTLGDNVYTIDKFAGWRGLDRDSLLALARRSFADLEREHRHLEERLAITVNRSRDTVGWWTFGDATNEIKECLAAAFWRWPTKNDETPVD